MSRPKVVLTAEQEKVLEAVATARAAELAAIETGKKRMWASIHAGPRAKVAKHVQRALDLGIPRRHLQEALGSKNFHIVDLYVRPDEYAALIAGDKN